MSATDLTATCGCCGGLVPATPVTIANRPGLSAVAYRVGTHPRFKASLLARLATSDHPALQQLTTRRDDDFAIGLCDAWATVADVLTFYQERIANESYLRTATERRSVAELARLIDYALRPGVAASTHLAFTVETATGAPPEAAILTGTRVMSIPGPGEKPQTFETVADLTARGAWNRFRAQRTMPGEMSSGATSVALAGTGLGLRVGDRLLFVGAGLRDSTDLDDWQTRPIARTTVEHALNRTIITWDAALPINLGVPIEVHVLRQRTALMGSSAPDPKNLATATLTRFAAQLDSPVGGIPTDWLFAADGSFLYLDGVYPGVRAGDYVLLENAAGTTLLLRVTAARALTRVAYSLSLRVTRLTLQTIGGQAPALDAFHTTNLRGTSAFFQPEPLPLADVPVATPVQDDRILLDASVPDLPAGRLLLVQGTDADTGEPAGETVTLLGSEPAGDTTRLLFTTNLGRRYTPESVVIYGNVAPATHGETVREVLGSGDGSAPFQRMKLRQPPLTSVPAKTATGAASTLELRVNGLAWREARTLNAAGPADRVFVTRLEEDGATVVQFGDGNSGARLPTGRENVTAVYRKGTGREGLLKAGQLSQLLTRPLGVKEAVNPLASGGAEDPESVDAARANCTLTIHTLDRVVSLQDYEDFARAFGGIAKALATWFWDGRRRGVLLTVAGPHGDPIPLGSELRTSLIAALRQSGDPRLPVDVRPHRPAAFGASIALSTDPGRVRADVLATVRAALASRFGFEQRGFAQPVMLDEVLAAAQAADGVVAANATRLQRTGLTGVEARLPAAGPVAGGGVPLGAELLTLDPTDLELADLA